MNTSTERQAPHIERFEFPEVEGVVVGSLDGSATMPTAGQLEALHRAAWDEGYAAGEIAGYAAGAARAQGDMERRAAALDAVLGEPGAPLAQLDHELVESVAELALLIARHLVRREPWSRRARWSGSRETLRHLPVATRGTTIHLNPEDVELVRTALALGDDPVHWRLEPILVTRGGCAIETETSRIDASVESRLAAIASRMFGGERESTVGAIEMGDDGMPARAPGAAARNATAQWVAGLQPYFRRLAEPPPVVVEGKLSRMVGLTLEAVGCQAAIGDRCQVYSPGGSAIDAEVVGFAGERLFLMPTGMPRGLAPNARVIPIGGSGDVAVGDLRGVSSMAPVDRSMRSARCAWKGASRCTPNRSIPCAGCPSRSRWMSAYAPSTRCSVWVAANASGCSHPAASARAYCSA